MENFIVSDWFAKRAKLDIQTVLIEGVQFELMALDESLIEDIKSCVSYEEMISLAANSGLSYNRKRIVNDIELSKDIDILWEHESVNIDTDPSVKHQVGSFVCEISGLEVFIEEQRASEEVDNTIDGDNLSDTDVTLGQLHEDAAAAISS